MRYYIIAGEASGDLHAANLMRELKELDQQAEFRCWGGDLMKEMGAHLVKHYRDLAFMGFAEVVMNLRTILKNLDVCKSDLLSYRPDVLILVDYPGFNLRMAKFAKEAGIRVVYYISPQAWAWKESRVHTIKKVVDRMLVILPFEKAFYQKHGYAVEFVGHPLLDEIAMQQQIASSRITWLEQQQLLDRPVIAVLPGSRKQEITTMLPLMLSVVKHFPQYQFVIGAAPSQELTFYRSLLGDTKIAIVKGQTYELLRHAYAALVTSGTATLETALFKVPEVVCYKGNRISYWIARALIKIRFISLVNLIMDREVVKELIQDELNERNLATELGRILVGPHRDAMLTDYEELKNRLGGAGASKKAATAIVQFYTETAR